MITRYALTVVEKLYGDSWGRDLPTRAPQLLHVESVSPFPQIDPGDVIDASSWGVSGSSTIYRVVHVEGAITPDGDCHELTIFVNATHSLTNFQ